MVLRISYSAVQSWRTCEQLYTYRYVDNLQPKVSEPPLELGTIIHNYLEAFYSNGSEDAHKVGMKSIRKDAKKITGVAELAVDLGNEEVAKKLLEIPETAKWLMRAYARVHGRNDLAEHRVVFAERWFQLKVKPGIVLPGKIDLLTEKDGEYYLWEHKTTGSIPDAVSRFADLQTLLYIVAAKELWDIDVSHMLWNYIRTTPPHAPATLKKGKLSVAKHQVTTRELVLKAIRDGNHDLATYKPFLRVVGWGERKKGFVRYTLPVSTSREPVLLRDYITSVEQIEDTQDSSKYFPVRNIGRQCDWCAFRKLCRAAIAGGDTDDLVARHFTKKDTKKKGGEKHGKEKGRENKEINALLEAN